MIECDKYIADDTHNVGLDKVNKLSVQRLPVVVGNAYAITRDPDRKTDEFFRSLNRLSLVKSRLHLTSREPLTIGAPSDLLSFNSCESLGRKEYCNSRERRSPSTESRGDVEASSEPSDGASRRENSHGENLGIVKSILGPTFEDAVLRTLEFGKSLIQKNERPREGCKGRRSEKRREGKEKRRSKACGTSPGEGDKRNGRKEAKDQRSARRRILFTTKNEREGTAGRKATEAVHGRPPNVAKIRSLDSELKQVSPSPEKIKRQLEALIQINKDEPPECVNGWNYFCPKDYRSLKPAPEYTVLPTTVTRRTCCALSKIEGCSCGPRCTGTGACCEGKKAAKENATEGGVDSPTKTSAGFPDENSARSCPNQAAISQAPEYISNALGPTLDVSIMDNLKLMRNLFRCEKSEPDERGEPQPGSTEVRPGLSEEAEDGASKARNGAATFQRLEDLQRRVEELTEKQMRLLREIEEEEQEREAKRKAFAEEQKKQQTIQASLQEMAEEERVRECHMRQSIAECRDYEQKFEALKCRIRSEEDRLSSLKELSNSYETEINEAKRKKENLQKKKSLLDAWDVIASRVCHTKLPSFSKVKCLERKNLRPNKDVQHCCFPSTQDEMESDDKNAANPPKRCKSTLSRSLDCRSAKQSKPQSELTPYPLQRDVTCGLHRTLKTCLCNEPLSKENASWSSEDDLRKSLKRGQQQVYRSRSEMGRREQTARLCKVMWAVTRINIFQDNSRTYEVMDATSVPPRSPPKKTEGVFVVKNPKKCCPEPQKRIP